MIKFVSSVFLSFLKLTNICRKMHGNTVLLKKAPKDYQRMLGNNLLVPFTGFEPGCAIVQIPHCN